MFGLLLRQSVNLLCGAVYLVQPIRTPIGIAIATVLLCWGGYRLATRALTATCPLGGDYALVLLVALSIPETIGHTDIATTNSFALAVCGSAILGFAVSQRSSHALACTLGISLCFMVGVARLTSVASAVTLFWPYFFLVQCGIGVFIWQMVLRSATAADRVSERLTETKTQSDVSKARRAYEREHWATVHDTAAATMLMVGQGVVVAPELLRRRAARDLRALAAMPTLDSDGNADLTAELRAIASESQLTVTIDGPSTQATTRIVADAVTGAVREALTNVARHSGDTTATMSILSTSVRVRDKGCGFSTIDDTAMPGGSGRGVRDSIVGRMRRIGGTAVIESTPGAGTEVTLDWTPAVVVEHHHVDPAQRAARLSRGYGLAMVGAAAGISILIPLAVYGPGLVIDTAQVSLVGILLAVTAVGAVGILWQPLPSQVLLVAVVAVCAVSFVQPLTVDVHFGTGGHWAFGTPGWVLLPLLVHTDRQAIAGALIANWLTTCLAAAVGDNLDVATFQVIGYSTASILAVQLLAGAFVVDLRRNATLAAAESAENADLLAQQAINATVQQDYRNRYEALATTTIPLLTAFADGSATTATPGVQQSAAVESARMRRLFVQADGQLVAEAHPLVADIQNLTKTLEARGISVTLNFSDDLPPLDANVRRALLAVPGEILTTTARTHARIVVTCSPHPQVSIVADAAGTYPDIPTRIDAVEIRAERDGDNIWVQTTHTGHSTIVGRPAT
jgi:signal transduction histidine kinase